MISKSNKHLGKLFYLVVTIVIVLYHCTFDLSQGDEVAFFSKVLLPGSKYSLVGQNIIGTLVYFTKDRYLTWTSRNIIEIILVLVSSLPQIVWHILDIVIVLFMLRTIDKAFDIKNTALKYVLMLLLLLTYPVSAMSSAGWMATTTNYSWVVALGIYMYYIIFQIRSGNFNIKEYIFSLLASLYALNNEQFTLFSLIVLTVILIYDFYNKRPIKALIPFWVINIVEFVMVLLCPGNSVRDDAMRYLLPEANADAGVLHSIFIGIRQIGIDIFEYSCLATVIVLLVMFVVNNKKDSFTKVIRIVLLMMAVYTLIRYIVLPHMNMSGLFENIRLFSIFRERNYSVILLSCIVGVLCLYVTSKRKDKAIIWAALIGGASTDGMLGFTVAWAVSGARTAIFFWVVRGLFALFLVKEFEESFEAIQLNGSKKIALYCGTAALAIGLCVWQLLNIPYAI